MEIRSPRATRKGPAETFAGDVWLDPLAKGRDPARVAVNLVPFAPGARSAWHTHAQGQTLFVLEGVGLVQARGEPRAEIRAGDVVYTPPGEEHWHGATPRDFMAHLSVTEVPPAPMPEISWRDQVSEAEYRGEPA